MINIYNYKIYNCIKPIKVFVLSFAGFGTGRARQSPTGGVPLERALAERQCGVRGGFGGRHAAAPKGGGHRCNPGCRVSVGLGKT